MGSHCVKWSPAGSGTGADHMVGHVWPLSFEIVYAIRWLGAASFNAVETPIWGGANESKMCVNGSQRQNKNSQGLTEHAAQDTYQLGRQQRSTPRVRAPTLHLCCTGTWHSR